MPARGQRYLQTVTRTDAQVGLNVDALKARGLYEDTLFVLIGDHGYQWYEHEHVAHVGFLYDPALRIPLIMKVPGAAAGTTVEDPVLQVDLLPTLMEIAGVAHDNADRTPPLPGVSLMLLLHGTLTAAVSASFREQIQAHLQHRRWYVPALRPSE